MVGFYPQVIPDYSWQQSDTINVQAGLEGWINFNVTNDIIDFLDNSFINRSLTINTISLF